MKRPSFLIAVTAAVGIAMWVLPAITRDNGILSFIVAIIGIFVGMGMVAFALKAHDDVKKVELADLWHPQPFWYFLAASILVGVSVFVGIILLIIPGLIVISMFAFAKYIVIDRNMGPIEAIKESMRITEGNRLEVLILVIMIVVINVIGLLPLLLGLLVTVPVSMLAFVHAYRALEGAGKSAKKSEAAAS